jgi:hypothetical protein
MERQTAVLLRVLKLSLYRVAEAHEVVRRRGSRSCLDNSQTRANLSDFHAGGPAAIYSFLLEAEPTPGP